MVCNQSVMQLLDRDCGTTLPEAAEVEAATAPPVAPELDEEGTGSPWTDGSWSGSAPAG